MKVTQQSHGCNQTAEGRHWPIARRAIGGDQAIAQPHGHGQVKATLGVSKPGTDAILKRSCSAWLSATSSPVGTAATEWPIRTVCVAMGVEPTSAHIGLS